MSYIALRFDAGADAAEGWVDALLAAGALSVDVADPHADTPGETPLFDEPDAPPAGLWPVSRLVALFPGAIRIPDVVAGLAEIGMPLPPHETYPIAEQDWVRATQAQFAPIRIADSLWIVPTWCDAVDAAAINLALDPGLAFGTGSHPTTRLCLAEKRRAARRAELGGGVHLVAAVLAERGGRKVDVLPAALMDEVLAKLVTIFE